MKFDVFGWGGRKWPEEAAAAAPVAGISIFTGKEKIYVLIPKIRKCERKFGRKRRFIYRQ